MNPSEEYLGLYWRDRPQNLQEYLHQVLDMFKVLGSILDETSTVRLIKDGAEIEVDLSDYIDNEEFFFDLLIDPDVAYKNQPGSHSKHHLISPLGFTSCWMIGQRQVTVSAGSYGDVGPGNSVVYECGGCLDGPEPVGQLRDIWAFLISHWSPEFAAISSYKLNSQLDPEFEYSFSLGWLSFFRTQKKLKINTRGLSCNEVRGGFEIAVPNHLFGSQASDVVDLLGKGQQELLDQGLIEVVGF